ncbi:dynein-1-beta heavy chain, flagellar inner arm I1 complex [Ceratina calcarata]|uniref:Dynein-1-beta heavy chain, flagellar inner arm I1 complex n=1 Tax=Ceratina calcarata TaxID=156304 RepID=A0AAJ7S056_9HYME|nr:dynein-1-beta heavy chain, flagellar inner arm I1 complex [Ceratina calcarata]
MSGKKEQKSDTSKKAEKMIDSHREFLDMDTDEEDFGRQESPEVEEELPVEPEKPVFSDDDLIILINHVKDLTMYTCPKVGWNEQSNDTIEEYFKNPTHTVLSTFFEKNELNATLNIATHVSTGFTYFLRSPWQIYTPENFLNTVSFGSISNNVKSNILKFMDNMYAPSILYSDDYESFLRNDIFSNLHQFIAFLMEEVYKPLSLTALYVPKERLLHTVSKLSRETIYFLLGTNETAVLSEEDESKRKLIERLDRVVWFWIRQIRKTTIGSTRQKIENIQDEVDYWKAKHSNFNHLRTQLLNPEVRLIIDILENLNSPTARKLNELTAQIDRGLKESSSNVTYLNVLRDFCKDLKVPEDAKNSVMDALLLILLIWTESPFYSTISNMEILCQALSSQIMHQCKNYVDLDVALRKNPEVGIQMLEKCIFYCDNYQTIYDNFVINLIPHISNDKKWEIRRQEVFNKIDIFKQRCHDVIEICKALIVFGRNNKIGLIGGPKGTDYEAYWREIETSFYESLNEIIIVRDVIFNVTKSVWLRKIKQFRYTVLQLENMVINLINDMFENVSNVEEGIEAIYALQKFKKRNSLQEVLHNKWTQIWIMFSNDIERCYVDAIKQSKKKTDIDASLSCVSQYLKSQHSLITNAIDWIGESDMEKCVLQQYEHVLDVLDKRRKMFNIHNTNGTLL